MKPRVKSTEHQSLFLNTSRTRFVGTCFIVTLAVAVSFASLIAGDQVSGDGAVVTSLLRVLCLPEHYNGKRIRVSGYYASGREYSGLFLTKESAEMGDLESALWIDRPSEARSTNHIARIRAGHVILVGTFYCRPSGGVGHLGAWPAGVKDITLFVRTSEFSPRDLIIWCAISGIVVLISWLMVRKCQPGDK